MAPYSECSCNKVGMKNEFMAETIKRMTTLLLSDEPSFENKVQECTFLDDHTVINLQNLRKLNVNPSSSDDRHAIPAVHPRSNNEESSKQKIENLQSQLRNAVDSCNKAKAAIEKDLEGIKNKNKEIEERNTVIDAAVTELDDEVTKIFLSADKQESWSRRHILVLKGIPETYGENTNKSAIDLFCDTPDLRKIRTS